MRQKKELKINVPYITRHGLVSVVCTSRRAAVEAVNMLRLGKAAHLHGLYLKPGWKITLKELRKAEGK